MKHAAAAIALAIACHLPAKAQQLPLPPGAQVDCLMKAVSEETRISAVHDYLESGGATRPDKTPAIAAALDMCGGTHSWSNEQRDLAYDIMMYKARMDELRVNLNALKAENVVASRVAGLLLYGEKKFLFDRDWRKDTALAAHVRSLLVGQAINDEEALRLGGDLIHAMHNYLNLLERWEAKWPTPPPVVSPPAPLVLPPPPPRPGAPARPG
jgi:hypothetical protein